MKLKPNHVHRSLTCLGWTAALSLIEFTIPAVVNSETVIPFDEPPCYMRTQDGRVVNLQSLCSHSTTPQTQPSPAVTNQSPQRTLSQQAAPTQVLPTRVRDASGSHANGNPDSDDGNY